MHDLLNQLKGARLSAFIALALNESEICLGLGEPLSIHAIAAQTHMSTRNALRAVQDLVEQEYVTPVSERGRRREKLYRVSEQARSGRAGATLAASRRKAPAKPDKKTWVSDSSTESHRGSQANLDKQTWVSDSSTESRRGSQANLDKKTRVSRSTTANSPNSSTKSKIDPDTLSGSMTESRRGSQANHDMQTRVSESATLSSRISSKKSKIDRDTLSGTTTARVPSAPRGSTAGRDPLAGSTTAISPISSTKSQIARAHRSGSPRAHTRTRTRPRARVVVVSNNTTSLLKHELKLLQQQQQAHFEASRAVFAAVPVYGKPLVKLARTVDVDLARAWVERLEDAPKSFTDPVGYLVKHLMHDPTEAPPEAWQKPKKKSLFDADFVKYVHGRPEHAQYCREHPEEVDCICGKDWCEETGQWV